MITKVCKTKQYRQGDVLLVKVDSLPKDATRIDSLIVAHGEVTGHAHAFAPDTAELFMVGDQMWVVADDNAVLQHQEHGAIAIEQGTYQVVRQQEYTPAAIVRVAD